MAPGGRACAPASSATARARRAHRRPRARSPGYQPGVQLDRRAARRRLCQREHRGLERRRRSQLVSHRAKSRLIRSLGRLRPHGSPPAERREDTTARVWDADSGRLLYSLRGHASSVDDASFDPNGRWVVTAGRSLAGLWDRASRQRLLFLPGHTGRVLAASFDPTGLRIMAVGADGTFRSYACDVCAGIPGLLRLAEQRIEATG